MPHSESFKMAVQQHIKRFGRTPMTSRFQAGLGGTIERGWEQISRRLDWVGTQFSDGTNTIERLVTFENCDLAYVVQLEHLRFRVPGQPETSTRDYRVTMVFRRESDGWKLVHRQADSQMMKQPTK